MPELRRWSRKPGWRLKREVARARSLLRFRRHGRPLMPVPPIYRSGAAAGGGKGGTRSRAPGPAYEGQEGAIMPNEENKSGEQKIAEAEVERFRKELGPFVVAAETTRMPMVFTATKGPGNPIIFANDSFLSLSPDTTGTRCWARVSTSCWRAAPILR